MHKLEAAHEALDVFGPWQLKAASLTARLGHSSHRQRETELTLRDGC
jgi:hypothetical protein